MATTTTQVELIDLPTKSSVDSTDYIVIDNGTTTYKVSLETVLNKAIDYALTTAIEAEY